MQKRQEIDISFRSKNVFAEPAGATEKTQRRISGVDLKCIPDWGRDAGANTA